MVIKQKHLIEFQIYYLLIVEALIDLVHFPSIIRYVLDANFIFMFFLMLPKIKDIINDKIFKPFSYYAIGYMFAIAAFSIIRRTPFGQVMWAARNNYFFIIFLFMCAYTLRTNDVKRILKNLVYFQFFNIVCVLYEYFVLGYYGDNVGGMFGTASGCNGYLNIYISIITAYVFVLYSNKKATLQTLLFVVLSSIVVAALSELKFFYIELVIIVILATVLSSVNAKSGIVVIVAVLTLFVGFQILTALDPTSAELLQDFDQIDEYSKTSYGGQIIARATPFSQINKYFFDNSVFYNLFGYGFGACESSETFGWANSAFSVKYGFLQYRNLSTSMLFVETGYIGIAAFMAVFVYIFVLAQKLKQKYANIRYSYVFAQVVSVIVIMNIWYNSSIRREIAYLTFFCLSVFIVQTRDEERQRLSEAMKTQPVKKSYFKKKRAF